jgi:hypothetical protein
MTSTDTRADAEARVPERSAGTGPARNGTIILLAAVGLVAAGVFVVARNAIVDDAYITLSYARNLAFHLHWGLTAQETSNTQTSPLNAITLAVLTAIVRRPILALGILYVVTNVLTAYGLLRVARATRIARWSAPLATALVLFNPLLGSAVGLEVALSAALMALLLMAAVEARPVQFGLYAGLLVLTRVELVIFGVILLIGCSGVRRAWWKALLMGAAVTLPWFAWSWVVLGSAVPDTMIIKALQPPDSSTFASYPFAMLSSMPLVGLLSFVPAVLGLLALLTWLAARLLIRIQPQAEPVSGFVRRFTPIALFGLAGVSHFVAYSVLKAPVFHWYYSWSIIPLTFLLALAVGALAGPGRTSSDAIAASRRSAGAIVGSVLALFVVAQGGFEARQGIPWSQAPYNGNAATPAQYAAVGLGIRPLIGDHTVQSPGEVGTIAYFCDCRLLDMLSDRGVVPSYIEQAKQRSGGLGRMLIDLNFHFLEPNLKPGKADYVISYSHDRPASGNYWPLTGPPWIGNGYNILLPAAK